MTLGVTKGFQAGAWYIRHAFQGLAAVGEDGLETRRGDMSGGCWESGVGSRMVERV